MAKPEDDHFSDSDESFHSFDDNEPSPADQPHQPPPSPTPGQPENQDSNTSSRIPKRRESSPPANVPIRPVIERFPPEEEASLLAESNSLKGSANTLFGTGSFQNAIQTYDKALASCPNYLDFELSVLRSNIAACYLKLQEWKDAVESATRGIEGLERLEPLPKVAKKPKAKAAAHGQPVIEESTPDEVDQVEEVDDDLEARIAALQVSGHTLDEVRKLQVKLLTRRAKANTTLGTWAALQAADEDYATLLHATMQSSMSGTDRRQTITSAQALTPKLKAAQENEVAEMMGKLKGLGNSLLGNFGLSTDNFQFIKDEKTGGYSMNFEQNPKKQ
ncbi:hypothetical protein LTR97_000249 [Elasticomyces elasticus]|uniref:Tetratricopeptide repeat protein 1 n=1 Tax=Elasticomyces elasticus TaxID=574655 RepID=A0AAN7WDA8_9PEZI|nr:hypothetical protein LTR97_000249 [Elasticomyces elasticus]